MKFTSDRIAQFIASAGRDFAIAAGSEVPEVVFKFAYDALIKIGIAMIAIRGYKVRSRVGHHVRIIEKMAEMLDDPDVVVMGNKMRQDRNLDLYGGGGCVSEKDSQASLAFVKATLGKAKQFLKTTD
ncbi:hypothetical protein HZB08_02175 [Candidatus Saganbacteria bacterium]|uniref:HEPN domain-containing protein n=1 Tax=Candidatus Saganbacteria bacterium TaxID=2575572 RepID=A0A9D6UMR8_UNCSA|nr:hypothetical protein [Candidatus Saganbacteria bacterium]